LTESPKNICVISDYVVVLVGEVKKRQGGMPVASSFQALFSFMVSVRSILSYSAAA
jgi:hypothetical protein